MKLQSIEIAWRMAWMRAIAAALPGPRAAAPPAWDARPYRVLYVRDDGVGDLIIATGVIRAIAQSHPTITVDVLASARNHEVLTGNPHVGRVVRVDRSGGRDFADKVRIPRVMRALRSAGYDVVVDGRVDNPPVFTSTPLKMLGAGAPYRVGAAGPNGHLIYNLPVPFLPKTVNYVERAAHLAAPFGVDLAATDFRPELFLLDAERAAAEGRWHAVAGAANGERVLVNLSAVQSARRWPDVRFVEAIRHMRACSPGLRVAVVAVPGEAERARAVAAAGGGTFVETASVRSVLALVGTADFVLTPDTGISHAAAAFGVPAVVLIPGNGLQYAPYYDRARLVVAGGWRVCDLPVGAVTRALDEMLCA